MVDVVMENPAKMALRDPQDPLVLGDPQDKLATPVQQVAVRLLEILAEQDQQVVPEVPVQLVLQEKVIRRAVLQGPLVQPELPDKQVILASMALLAHKVKQGPLAPKVVKDQQVKLGQLDFQEIPV